jgi:hypothetical protein
MTCSLYHGCAFATCQGYDVEIALCGTCPLTFSPVSMQKSKFAEYLEHGFAGVLQPHMSKAQIWPVF